MINKIGNNPLAPNIPERSLNIKPSKAGGFIPTTANNKELFHIENEVNDLLISYLKSVNNPVTKNNNPQELFNDSIIKLVRSEGPEKVYSAFLNVIKKGSRPKVSELDEIPTSISLNTIKESFRYAIRYFDNYAKTFFPLEIRKTCLEKISVNIKNLVKQEGQEILKYQDLLRIFKL